jgi:tol-pal system protein YbgF
MPLPILFLLHCAALLLLGGCALIKPPPQTEVPKDLPQLRQQQQELAQRLQKTEESLAQLEQRMRNQEAKLTQMRSAQSAQKVTAGGELTPPASAAPPSPAAQPASGEPPPANELYMQAFADYASGHFREAAAGFETFLEHYADNAYAGNAQFWLGECFYSLQQYPRAIQEYQRTVERYPQGGKTPEALLKMAAALRETNQSGRAREVLQTLQQLYPDSAAAQRARQGQ